MSNDIIFKYNKDRSKNLETMKNRTSRKILIHVGWFQGSYWVLWCILNIICFLFAFYHLLVYVEIFDSVMLAKIIRRLISSVNCRPKMWTHNHRSVCDHHNFENGHRFWCQVQAQRWHSEIQRSPGLYLLIPKRQNLTRPKLYW